MNNLKLKNGTIHFAIIILLLVSYSPVYAGELLVSAAISLQNAFSEIAAGFEEAYPNDKVILNFASTGQLKKQIEQGAKVDVFASASAIDMDTLIAGGLIDKEARRAFASNSLVIISYNNISDIEDLLDVEYKRIAIGNPVSVPAGRYAVEALKYFNVYDKLKKRLVLAENVRQALDYVRSGALDAGMVYGSDLLLIRDSDIKVFDVDNKSHEVILYQIAVVKGSDNQALAKRFIEFVSSEHTKNILEEYGFYNPEQVK